jgi:hypothetical protein
MVEHLLTDSDQAEPPRSYQFPCPATPGEWSNCAIDRRTVTEYLIPQPEDLPLVAGVAAAGSDPMMTASIGNLTGGLGLDLVFSDSLGVTTTEDGGSNPGYLCVNGDGEYGPCPSELDLPTVTGQVMAVAIEYLNGDESPDMMILSLQARTSELGDVMQHLYTDGIDAPTKLSFYSQESENGDSLPHWIDRSEEVGLGAAFTLPCAAANIQLIDLDHDMVPEVILGGYACAPFAFQWDDGQLVQRFDMLPSAIGTNTGVFTTQRPDRTQNLFLISYDGYDRGAPRHGGSTCWRGEPHDWTAVRCPEFGGSPMGITFLDPNKDGLLEVASSDTNGDRFCAEGYIDNDVSIGCFDASWQLPGNFQTLAGVNRHSLSWAVGAWSDYMVQVQGYEHSLEPDPTTHELIPWHNWPQQIHLYQASPDGTSWTRVHNPAVDADVQERGLIGPMDLNGDGCSDLLPLTVGVTNLRALIDGTCAEGTQEVAFRSGSYGAYGTQVVMLSDGQRQATVIGSSGGVAGFTPPVKSVGPHITLLEVYWTSGEVTVVGRNAQGRFPDTITPLTPAY